MASGMLSQSSPVSMLFLAKSFILARLPRVSIQTSLLLIFSTSAHAPILEPDLNGAFCHINFLRNAFPDRSSRRGILIKFHFQGE